MLFHSLAVILSSVNLSFRAWDYAAEYQGNTNPEKKVPIFSFLLQHPLVPSHSFHTMVNQETWEGGLDASWTLTFLSNYGGIVHHSAGSPCIQEQPSNVTIGLKNH